MNQFNPLTPPLPQRPAPEEDFIDLGRLFRAVMRYKWGILGLAFAVTLVTALVVYSMERIYSASASIVLESQQAIVVNVVIPPRISTRAVVPFSCSLKSRSSISYPQYLCKLLKVPPQGSVRVSSSGDRTSKAPISTMALASERVASAS